MIVVHDKYGAMPLGRYYEFCRNAITNRWTKLLEELRRAELLTNDGHDSGDEDRSGDDE